MPREPGQKPETKAQKDKDARLASALKENLRRRKAASTDKSKPRAIKNEEKF